MRNTVVGSRAIHYRRGADPLRCCFRPWLNLGLVLMRRRRFADAVPFLEKSRELQPGLADAGLRLGEAFLETGRLDEAERLLAEAMAGGPAVRAEAMIKLAIVKVEKDDQAAAVRLLQDYLAEYPKAGNRAEIEAILKQLRP